MKKKGAIFAGAVVLLLATACAPAAAPRAPAAVAPVDSAAKPDTAIRVAVMDSTSPGQPVPVRAALPVHLTFTGDINLGTSTLPDGLPPDEGRQLLAPLDSLLTGDMVVGNFEGVLADTGTSTKCDPPPTRRRRSNQPAPSRANCYSFMTPTRLAPRLAEAGFTHLNLANNHAQDLGLAGRTSTETTLRGLGLKVYGPLGQISIDTVQAGDSLTVVGIIGFTTYPFAYNLLDIPGSIAVVDSIKSIVDIVVVTFHGGAEGVAAQHVGPGEEFLGKEPRGDVKQWSHAMIDAGADLVVGHGPHVLRGIEFYRGKPVVYSLGNFLTYRGFNLEGPLGVSGLLSLELSGTGDFLRGRLIPLVQPPRVGPRVDDTAAALAIVRRLSLDDFGGQAARIADDGTIRPPEAN
jgi:hypothetical protein